MVDPVSDQERSSFVRKVKAAFVVLVGLSAGLITLQSDAGVQGFLVATAAGTALGVILVWVAFPDARELQEQMEDDEEREYGWDQ